MTLDQWRRYCYSNARQWRQTISVGGVKFVRLGRKYTLNLILCQITVIAEQGEHKVNRYRPITLTFSDGRVFTNLDGRFSAEYHLWRIMQNNPV